MTKTMLLSAISKIAMIPLVMLRAGFGAIARRTTFCAGYQAYVPQRVRVHTTTNPYYRR
jgi:hypothetical protein